MYGMLGAIVTAGCGAGNAKYKKIGIYHLRFLFTKDISYFGRLTRRLQAELYRIAFIILFRHRT